MRITGITCRRVEVSRRGGWLFVQVATDAGLTGLGEASQGGDDGAVAETIERRLAPWLDGKSPLDVEPFWQRFASLGASRVGATALSGVEQALWDLAGQAAGQPVWRLLGGRLRPRLWVYANINRSTWERSPEGFAANARRAVGAGFRAVKLAPFDDVPRLDTPEAFATIALGIDRVLAVREAVGPEVQVLVDCHCHFNAAWAVRVARRLEPARLYWYEDPLPRSDPEGLLRVRQSIEQPVAAGETFFGRRPFWDLFTPGGGRRGHAGREALRGDPGATAHRRPGRAGPRAGGPPQSQRPGGPGRHGPRGAGPAQLRHPGARLRRGGVAGGAGRPAGGDRGRLLQPPGGPRPGAAPQPRRDPLVTRLRGLRRAPLGRQTKRPAPGSRWGPSPRGTGRPRRAC